MKRPDRVMINGDCVTIVDYKFGEKISPKHETQISAYVEILKQMKYSQVEGYLWYISKGEIIKVV